MNGKPREVTTMGVASKHVYSVSHMHKMAVTLVLSLFQSSD